MREGVEEGERDFDGETGGEKELVFLEMMSFCCSCLLVRLRLPPPPLLLATPTPSVDPAPSMTTTTSRPVPPRGDSIPEPFEPAELVLERNDPASLPKSVPSRV